MTDTTKTYKEQLELNRPDDWLTDAANSAERFLDEKEETLSSMSLDILLENFPEVLPACLVVPNLAGAFKFMATAFFYFGYYKGLQDGEDREKVRRMVDG